MSLHNRLSGMLNKGVCIFLRHGYVGLAGYIVTVEDRIPTADRRENVIYEDFIKNDIEEKTRVYTPRDDRIVLLARISVVDKDGKQIAQKWEVKTHWSVRRNIFDDFESAWEVFCESEQRYDPGRILWSKLEEYDEFEPY